MAQNTQNFLIGTLMNAENAELRFIPSQPPFFSIVIE
jgi:hypothetical protein